MRYVIALDAAQRLFRERQCPGIPSLSRRPCCGGRLRRGIAVADLAARAGTSASTVARLEKGHTGVGIGALADVPVVLGLVDRLGDLIDIRRDDLGLSLTAERQPRRGRSFSAKPRQPGDQRAASSDGLDGINPDGAEF